MKNQLLILILIVAGACSQHKPKDYMPSFSAVIVKDVAQSSKWYQSVFDLKVKDQIGNDTTDYKIMILESEQFMLELLQLKNAVAKNDVLADKPEGTYIQGHFKIGFKVSDIDSFLSKLKGIDVDVPTIYKDEKNQKRNFLITDPDGNLIQFFE